MDLLERYLQAVRLSLPRAQQDDIVRELSDDLLAQMEAREEALGRALTEDEQAEVLRASGHPLVVAGRYRGDRHLIGPAFYPVYLFVLKIGFGVILLVALVLAILGSALSDDPRARLIEILMALPARGVGFFTVITLAFAALERWQSRFTMPKAARIHSAWDPRHLPHLVRFEHPISHRRAVCELLLSIGCLVIVLLAPGRPSLMMGGPAARLLEFAPIWASVYLPFVLVTAAAVIISIINVIRPYWTTVRSVARLVSHAGAMLVFLLLLQADAWMVMKGGVARPNAASLERAVGVVNVTFEIGLIVAAIGSLAGILWEIRRIRSYRRGSASSAAAAAHAGR